MTAMLPGFDPVPRFDQADRTILVFDDIHGHHQVEGRPTTQLLHRGGPQRCVPELGAADR
jgi:hypothetical protein